VNIWRYIVVMNIQQGLEDFGGTFCVLCVNSVKSCSYIT